MSLLERTIEKIYPQDSASRDSAKNRLDNLAIPHRALGDLMDLAIDIAGMVKTVRPEINKKAIVTMAGDHGVCVENISKYPSEVTPQMVYNFVAGGAGINALAGQSGTETTGPGQLSLSSSTATSLSARVRPNSTCSARCRSSTPGILRRRHSMQTGELAGGRAG